MARRYDNIDVVDLDLVNGGSALLISYQHIFVPFNDDYHLKSKIKVVEDIVLGWTPGSFTLTDVVTGETARIRDDVCLNDFYETLTIHLVLIQEHLELENFDVVRGTVVYMLCNATYGTPSIYVANVSRIFAHSRTDPEEPTWLRNVCEAIVNIPCIMPTEMPMTMEDPFICDPSQWGSPLPCRILFLQTGLVGNTLRLHAEVHRYFLTFDPETSVPVLTPHGTMTSIVPHNYDFWHLTQTRSGHWLIFCDSYTPLLRNKKERFKRLTLLTSEFSGDIIPMKESSQEVDTPFCDIERYSGTVWCHSQIGKEKYVTLQYFN